MKTKIFAIMCIILLLVCLVACNNRDPNGDLVTTGREPFAKPDPSNPYDQKIGKFDFYSDYNRQHILDNILVVTFTNSESLNNLFYDFVPKDFPKYDIKEIRNTLAIADTNESIVLANVRQQVSQGDAYADTKLVYIEQYCRSITIVFNFNDIDKLADICDSLYERPEIRCISPGDNSFQWFEAPNDAMYQTNQQNLAELIGLEEAWDHTTGSSSVKVGVLDSGVLGTHADLVGNLNTSLSGAFGSVTTTFADEANHGTSVAGIIGATGDNGTGVAGICWDIDLISLKISGMLGDYGVAENFGESPEALALALQYAENNNIRILNFSGGWTFDFPEVRTAIENYNGLLICAAGNSNIDMDASGTTKVYPACYTYSNILTVGASTMADAKYGASNYGATSVDIFAPGVGIYTTNSSGGYGGFSYTSAATPVVTGIAGLLLSYDPTLTTSEIKTAILDGSDKLNVFAGKCVSAGRVNAWGAIKALRVNLTYQQIAGSDDHLCECHDCGRTFREAHTWQRLGEQFKCRYCGALKAFIPVIRPTSISSRYQLLLQQASMTADNPNMFSVDVDEHSQLLYYMGSYYLIYDCNEQGLPKYQISTDFLAYGYTIVGNQIVSTSEIEIPPIYEPVVKTA